MNYFFHVRRYHVMDEEKHYIRQKNVYSFIYLPVNIVLMVIETFNGDIALGLYFTVILKCNHIVLLFSCGSATVCGQLRIKERRGVVATSNFLMKQTIVLAEDDDGDDDVKSNKDRKSFDHSCAGN